MALETQNRGLEVHVREGGSAEIVELLEDTVLGTPGKLRYRRQGSAEQIRKHKQIEFIQITKRDRVLGTAGVITRSTQSGLYELTALYVRYLSVKNPFGRRKRSENTKSAVRESGRSALRDRIAGVITRHFEEPYQKTGTKAAFYAYVEAENENSRALCMSLGFMPQRKVNTLLFSRFFPERSGHIDVCSTDDESEVREQLQQFYSGHSFWFEDDLFEKGTYFVSWKDGMIVAGVRAIPVEWEIVDIPGWKGFLMTKVLPYLPLTGRIFEPEHFRFLTFDQCWHLEGHEREIGLLMEHALSSCGKNTGMCWLDEESELCDHLKHHENMGLLHRLNGAVTADLMLRLIHFTGEEKSGLLKRPVFVAAPDMT